jgi:hypothetical protein
LTRLSPSTGASLDGDSELNSILDQARGTLVGFATVEWLELAPVLVTDFVDFLETLEPGVSLFESQPDFLLSVPQPVAPDSSVSSNPPPPADPTPSSPAPSPPTAPSPPASRTLSSGGDPSPHSAPESDAGPSAPVLRSRSKRVAAYRSPRAPPEELTARPAVASPVVVVPPAVATRSSKKRTAIGTGLRPDRSCTRCSKRRKACRYPVDADSSNSACALCIQDQASCSLLDIPSTGRKSFAVLVKS